MTTLRSKAFNFPATGDFKCELTLIENWNGAYIVKVQGDERGIHSKNMENNNKIYQQLLKLRNITYVTPKEFEQNLRLLKKSFKNAQFIVVPVGPPNEAYQKLLDLS